VLGLHHSPPPHSTCQEPDYIETVGDMKIKQWSMTMFNDIGERVYSIIVLKCTCGYIDFFQNTVLTAFEIKIY
jgi:hypothetical protein